MNNDATGLRGGRVVIFTDLDGTLLDYDTYSCGVVASLVAKLGKAEVPVVFCSSKTRAEQEVYRKKLGIGSPFIVEDGGAIFIEAGYFPFPYDYHRATRGYQVIEMGMSYGEIRRLLREIRQRNNLAFRGFGDMDAAQVAGLSGLDLAQAKLACERSYEETLALSGSQQEIRLVLDEIEKAGLKWTRGGRFYGVTGGNDKGMAVGVLIGLYNRKLGRIKTIGIGDSPNDVSMLAEVDVPLLVQKPGGHWEKVEMPGLLRVDGIGPQGWVKAITELVGV